MKHLVVPAFILAVAACSSAPSGPPVIPDGRPPLRQPPANAVGGFAIDVPEATLKPGDETFPCWIFPLTVDGPSHLVGGATLAVGPGMHHGNIVTRPATGSGIRRCASGENDASEQAIDIIQGGTVLFGSSTQFTGTEWQSLPDGKAYRVKDGFEIVARLHYLNATTAPVVVAPRYQWYTVDEAKVTQEVFPFIWSYNDINIAPHTQGTVEGDCSWLDTMNVVLVLPHMHKLGTRFEAGFTVGPNAGKNWLDSPGYDPENGVLQIYDPPVPLTGGGYFRCTWDNTLDQTVTYGVGNNEMCMLFGYAFPQPTSYTAVVTKKDGCATLSIGN